MLLQFIIYSAGAILLRLITAGSILATVKFIPPAQFGLLSLLNNLIVFLPIILGLGLRQALAIDFFNYKNTWKLVWELVIIYLIWAIPITIFLFFNLNNLNQLLFFNQIDRSVLALALLTSLLNFFPELLFQILRFKNKALNLIIIQIGMGALLASITIYLLRFDNLGLSSVIWAQFITQLLATSYFIYLLVINKLSKEPQKIDQTLSHLKTGLPFVPNIIFAWLIMACNRWLLNWQLDLKEVGLYSLAENISLIFQALITQPMMHSFLPYAFKNFSQNYAQIEKLDKQYTRWACYFILFFVTTIPLGYIIFRPILFYLLPPKYIGALPLITPLIIAQVIFASTYLTSASVQYRKKTHYLAILMAGSALVAILLNLWLIPIYGSWACVIATNCAYLFYLGLIQGFKISKLG